MTMNRRTFLYSAGIAASAAFSPGTRCFAAALDQRLGLAPSEVYPSDSYIRPETDSLPVFETLCGIHASGDMLQRSREFAMHKLELIDWRNESALSWTWQRRENATLSPALFIDERLNRMPERVTFFAENRGDSSIAITCQLSETPWWIDPSRTPKTAEESVLLAAGDAKELNFRFDQDDLRQPLSLALLAQHTEAKVSHHLVFARLETHYPQHPPIANTSLRAIVHDLSVTFTLCAQTMDYSGNVDIQCEQARWTLWRIRLTRAEKQTLTQTGSVRVERAIPWFLSARELTATVICQESRIASMSATFTVPVRPVAELPLVQQETVGGVPTATISRRPIRWSGYSSFDFQPGNVNEFGAHGANIFLLVTNAGRHIHNVTRPTWIHSNVHDYGELDEAAAMALAANNGAHLLLRVSLSLPPFWFKEHPEARVRIRDSGRDMVWEESGGIAPSLSSITWREQQAENLRHLILYVRKQPWAARVIGVILCGGVTEEWFSWASLDTRYSDYSEPQQQAFLQWCKERGLPFHTIPEPAERNITGQDFFSDTPVGRAAAAYADFNSDVTAETISYFAGIVKDATEGRSLAGAYYGYTIQLTGEPRQSLAGQMAVRRLLDDPNIDFLAGIPLHDFRKLELAADTQAGATASLQLAGKTFINEDDLFSWLHNAHWHTLYNPSNPRAGAICAQRRVMADDVVHGLNRHWYSLFCNWHHDELLQAEFGLQNRIQAESLTWNRTPEYEIAFVVDDNTFSSITPFSPLLHAANVDLLHCTMLVGAPVGTYLLSDIDKIPQHVRMIIVASAFAPQRADLEKLQSVIHAGGRTIVVVGAIGLIDAASKHWNEATPREITGLPIVVHQVSSPGVLQLSNGRRITVVEGSVNPYASIEAEGWAVYSETRITAGTERPLAGNGTLLWSALPPVDPALLRGWAERAGVTLYAPAGFSVHASRDVVSITAGQPAIVTVNLPKTRRARDLFNGTYYDGPRFSCRFTLGQTRLFHREHV